MLTDVTSTLRQALSRLAAERQRIDRQTAAIQEAMRALNGGGDGRGASSVKATTGKSKRGRRQMSPAERKAVGRRMKAYWAKRRAGRAKRKPTNA
jgi:hypothetical protein